VLPALISLLVLLAGAALAAAQTGGAGRITLRTTPPAAEIIPDVVEEPTTFVIEATDSAGRPLRNAYFQVEMTAPTSGPFVSSDIPAIEGTTLLQSRFPAPEGRLEFKYVVPIRGTYRVNVQAIPGPGAGFTAFSQQLTLQVRENPAELRNLVLLVVGLLGLGVASGVVLGYANRR